MYDIERFLTAQENTYDVALSEIKNGKKESHWIWYIFPQLKGLGYSENSEFYGLDGIREAKEYLQNDILRERLIEISSALLELPNEDPIEIFGYTDAKKVMSCMTLFSEADPFEEVFVEVLNKFYLGVRDNFTLSMLYQ
jgi:uncharacterized protein (DUF1810 family)